MVLKIYANNNMKKSTEYMNSVYDQLAVDYGLRNAMFQLQKFFALRYSCPARSSNTLS